MASFTSTLRAVLEMDTAPFRRGASQAVDVMKQTRRQLGDIGAGAFTRFLGVGALTIGFRSALEEARRLRAEARELGTDLDPAVARTAELADNLDRAARGLAQGGAQIVGWVQAGVNNLVAAVMSAVDPNASYAENIAAIAIADANAESGARDALAEAARQGQKKAADEAEARRLEAIQRGQEAYEKLGDEIFAKRREQAFEEADAAERLRMIQEDVAAAQAAVSSAVAGTIERREAELRLIEQEGRERKEIAKQEKEAADAAAKWLDEIIEKTAEALANQKAFADATQAAAAASQRAAGAEQDLATANRDRVAFGVGEAASGERGTREEQRQARRIRGLEERARRAYDRGAGVAESRDQRGAVVRETGEQQSARLLAEADALRRGFGNRLVSSERDPLAAQKTSLLEALNEAQTLLDIRNSLERTEAPGA